MQIKHGRWFLALVTTINLAWIAPPALAAEKQSSEGKVAIVNGSVISLKDFNRETNHVLQQLASKGKTSITLSCNQSKRRSLKVLSTVCYFIRKAKGRKSRLKGWQSMSSWRH
jgi:hypothetical protein